jgi:thiamine kinase-like enzyme
MQADLALKPNSQRALHTATEVVEDLGLSFTDAVVLRDQSNLLVHFRPTPVVARIATGTVEVRRGSAWLARELAVASHLSAAGAPVVPPSSELPPGPHLRAGFVMTLWEYVGELDEAVDPSLAGRTLRECHEALDDFEGELPVLGALEEAARIVSVLREDGILSSDDCQMLRRTSERSFRRIEKSGLRMRPVHGDANLSNALNTPSGPIWTDWEDTFKGPREWDLACLVTRSRVLGEGAGRAEAALAAYDGAVDDELLDLLVEARALQVAVWLALGSLSLSAEDVRMEERLEWLRARDADAARKAGERSANGEDE